MTNNDLLDQVNSIPSFGEFDFHCLYAFLVAEAPPGSTLVEVGCYHGRSLCYLGLLAKRANKGLRIVGVDWCKGMGDNKSNPTGDALRSNINRFGLQDTVTLIAEPTEIGAAQFADGSVFAAFIDDNHDEEPAKLSISSWLPKVQRGGFICGHDLAWVGVWKAVRVLVPQAVNGPTQHCWIARVR